MHSDVYQLILFELGIMIEGIELYVLSLVNDLDFHSRSQGCEKAKTSAPIVSQSLFFFVVVNLDGIWCAVTVKTC